MWPGGGDDTMKIYVNLTDSDWFNFLVREQPDELNFWRPGGKQGFRALKPNELFLFKLHSPSNFIVGGGFFVRHVFLPLSLAWEAFKTKMECQITRHSGMQFINIVIVITERTPDPKIRLHYLVKAILF